MAMKTKFTSKELDRIDDLLVDIAIFSGDAKNIARYTTAKTSDIMESLLLIVSRCARVGELGERLAEELTEPKKRKKAKGKS